MRITGIAAAVVALWVAGLASSQGPKTGIAGSDSMNPLAERYISGQAHSVRADLLSLRSASNDMERLRRQYLDRQLSALEARVRMLKGERLSFDEESKALYDAVAPVHDTAHFQKIRSGISSRDQGVPRPNGASCHTPRQRELHGRVRHEQVMERLQLVQG